jgi:hypothetical protein
MKKLSNVRGACLWADERPELCDCHLVVLNPRNSRMAKHSDTAANNARAGVRDGIDSFGDS